ncbi:FAD-binding protein [Arhodomonas aquaeolei]|uniref:FAD-binding oxidoreductase n=1 Tax=Arhodomonas aquaeolei TaxID=2369 RepID=UPI002168AC87|nr:FAD-linked oxidase C-terminal domain-containing protein [Arhodomonas aquaeolei]MCS4504984.1 FAD-binding protein [Arhodomonas aquaeolei]
MSAVEPLSFGPVEPAVDALRELLGERLSTATAVREHHGHDESGWPVMPPDAVAFPQSTEEVAEVARICHAHRVPIIPYGTGTAVEGHVQALHGGVAVDLSGMNRVRRVSTDDMDATVEAGVTRKQLNAELRDTGLFFPVDPGADASIGGMVSTRASGTNAVRYGTMADNLLSLTVVLVDGRVVRTGGRARKSSAGYDLTHLFTGAEGTLGLVTEITLRLHGLPEATSAAICAFPDEDAAVRTVIETIQCGVHMARMELMDALQMRATNAYSGLDYPERPHLFLEFHGSESGVREQAELVQALAAENGGADFAWAVYEEDRSRLWQARHDAYPAALQLRPGCRPLTTDVCVPISRLAECIRETRRDLEALPMPSTILGHVGDGNFHVIILCDPDSEDEIARAKAVNEGIVYRAQDMEGTCTGEHGIGQGKIAYLRREHGEGVSVMQAVKDALDPLGLMNPGKVLPPRA